MSFSFFLTVVAKPRASVIKLKSLLKKLRRGLIDNPDTILVVNNLRPELIVQSVSEWAHIWFVHSISVPYIIMMRVLYFLAAVMLARRKKNSIYCKTLHPLSISIVWFRSKETELYCPTLWSYDIIRTRDHFKQGWMFPDRSPVLKFCLTTRYQLVPVQ